jgi:hypothetical protein
LHLATADIDLAALTLPTLLPPSPDIGVTRMPTPFSKLASKNTPTRQSAPDSLLRLRELSPIEIKPRCDPRLASAIYAFQAQAAAWDMIRVVLNIYDSNKQVDRKRLLDAVMPSTLSYISRSARKPLVTLARGKHPQGEIDALRRSTAAATALVQDFAKGFLRPNVQLPKSEPPDLRLFFDLVFPAFQAVLSTRRSATAEGLGTISARELKRSLSDSGCWGDLDDRLSELEWLHGYDGATIRSFRSATYWLENRMGIRASGKRRMEDRFRQARGKPAWYRGKRCALCEKPTHLTSTRASSKESDGNERRLSNTYCVEHVQPRTMRNRNITRAKVARFDFILEKLWEEFGNDLFFF